MSLSKTSGARGTDVTITGKGFGKNINAIFVDTDADGAVGTDDITIATSISVDDGAFSYDFTVGKGYPLTSYINVRDVAGTALHMHTLLLTQTLMPLLLLRRPTLWAMRWTSGRHSPSRVGLA